MGIGSTKDGDVIENLQPSKYLKKLSIRNYVGKQFPNWLLNNSLPNLVSLVLRNCKSCQRFPPLGLLPFLKKLVISRCYKIVIIDDDFHGNNSCSFKSLETLAFSFMEHWEKWECQAMTGAFPRLQYLSITVCPKLQLEWSTMKRLRMDGSDTSLQHLDIYSFPKAMSDDYLSPSTFPLHFFPKLRTLELYEFLNLQMISQGLICNHLEELEIRRCHRFESLPRNMHTLLPSLRRLRIEDCPRLESRSPMEVCHRI
ncbi:putative disease resistance RPP13-like protein 1 [Phaseolus vulgaris]|uniref:putative disease resistance RPP13-like protein 1 n=1 Tax=Phaseolus vulgaris TaxID=3885 RepID=UPI0035CAA9A4